MQTHTHRAFTPKESYFRQRADAARRQVIDAETRLIRYESDAEQFTSRGRPVPAELNHWIDELKHRIRNLKSEMHRALSQAGRM